MVHTTNNLGLRGKDITLAKPPGVRRILVLGDSYTFGVYVEDDEVYPALLENFLQDRGFPVQVLNAGYADGWSPDEHYAWLMDRGFAFSPDLVVYGFFIGNDVSDICKPCWRDLDERGLPRRMVNANVYVDAFGRVRSRVLDSHTVGHEWIMRFPLLRESHLLVRLSRRLEDLARDSRRKTPRHDSAGGGHDYGEEYFSMILDPKREGRVTAEREELLLELVYGMEAECASRDIGFLLLMIPVNFQVHEDLLRDRDVVRHQGLPLGATIDRNFFDEIKPALDERGVSHLDMLEAMKGRAERFYPSNGEVHFNAEGHRFTAVTLMQLLLERHLDASG